MRVCVYMSVCWYIYIFFFFIMSWFSYQYYPLVFKQVFFFSTICHLILSFLLCKFCFCAYTLVTWQIRLFNVQNGLNVSINKMSVGTLYFVTMLSCAEENVKTLIIYSNVEQWFFLTCCTERNVLLWPPLSSTRLDNIPDFIASLTPGFRPAIAISKSSIRHHRELMNVSFCWPPNTGVSFFSSP